VAKQTKYTKEFKEEAVQMVSVSGMTLWQVASVSGFDQVAVDTVLEDLRFRSNARRDDRQGEG